MSSKRTYKRKSAGDEPKGGGNEFAKDGVIHSEPRPSTKHPRIEVRDKKAESIDLEDVPKWTTWIEKAQKNEHTNYRSQLNEFSNSIQKSTGKCRAFLEQRTESLQPLEPEAEPLLKSAHEIANSLRLEESQEDGNAFFRQAQDVLESSGRLLTLHKEAEETIKGEKVETPVLLAWRKDRRDIKEILGKGREYGGKMAANHLAPGTFSPSDLDNAEASEHEKKAAGMFQDGQQTKPEDCWGPAAAQQFEHFKNLANSFQVIAGEDADGHVVADHGGNWTM